MADRPSQPHPAFVPPTLFDAPIDGAGDDDLRQRIRERSPFARRYQRQRGLASGQMSDLLLARDHLIGRAIAFKTLPVDRAGDRDVELRFLREATIQGQLEHPAIVPVYDLGVDPEGNIYFTMKRIRGINLDEILDGISWDREGFRATYTRRRLIQALANVALAVDFAHRRGIIHRDLKPSNIMLGDFGEVYVLDWGLARIDTSLIDESESSGRRPAAAFALRTLPGALLGTPGYMAPEQLGAAEEVRPTADVYALGAILFEILTDTRLHDHDRPADRVRSTIQEAPPRPSERRPEPAIPPELDALCFAAIQRDPSARLPDARSFHDALERFLAGERDVELRGELAAQHVDAAQVHREAKDDPVAARRRAIRELGRALALDPGNDRATNDLLALLNEVPSETPEEVERLAAGARRRYWRIVARFSGLAYLSIFLYAPLLLWNGATAMTTVVFFYLLITLAAALSFWVSRQEEPAIALVLLVHAVSNIAFATLGGLTGPLFVVPMVVTVNAGGFALLFGRRLRWWIFTGGALAIFVPLALELAGVVAPTYEFVDGAMIIRPRWVEARPLPSLVFLSVAALTSLGTATLLFSELREMVLRSERRFYVHAWQLRQLLPGRLR